MILIFCPISQPFLPPLLPSSPSPTVGDSMEYPRVPGGYGEEAGKREREREKRYRRPKAPHQPSLYLSTARFIVGKPADFFSFLFWAATHRPTHRPVSRVEHNDN